MIPAGRDLVNMTVYQGHIVRQTSANTCRMRRPVASWYQKSHPNISASARQIANGTVSSIIIDGREVAKHLAPNHITLDFLRLSFILLNVT